MDNEAEEEAPPPNQGQSSWQQGQRASANEQIISATVASLTEYIKKKKFEEALEICNKALSQCGNNDKLLEKKIKILCHQGHFEEAYSEALIWLQREPRHPVAIKELKRLKIVLDALKDQESDEETPPPAPVQKTEVLEPATLAQPSPHHTVAQHVYNKPKPTDSAKPAQSIDLYCSFCKMTFDAKSDLDTHCRSDEHKKNITSDEGHSWKYRPPPRGLVAEDYTLCQKYTANGRCPYADKCIEAHSNEELEEWRERFKFKRQQLQMAKDKHLHGNTYPEQLMEKLMTAEYPKSVMVANVDYAKVIVNSDLKVNMISKKCTHAWTFTITSKICILRVVLLDEAVSNYFYISSISVGPKKTQKYQNLENHCQEWKNPEITINRPGEYVYRVKVVFKTDIYGTFRETLVFDFGSEPVLSRDMHVESAPVTDTEKVLSEIRLSQQGRWLLDQVSVVEYKQKAPEDQKSIDLLKKYALPGLNKFKFSEHLMHSPTKENYRLWMHQMLYVEELSQIDKISKFNITTSLQLVNRFLLMPGSLSAAKFAQDGELFARMKLEDDLSVDSVAGRLILKSTNLVWLAPHKPGSKNNALPKKVYEAVIEDRGKNFIFLRLSSECVEELELTCDQEFSVEVQFQLNRLHFCEMHHAVDALSTLDIVFPPTESLLKLPEVDWTWKEDVGEKTNENQKDAIMKCAAYSHMALPPLLIVGPFGTGKTYTLAQCAKHVLLESNTRILICTHSNSAADIYIKEFLHPYVMEGNLDARPLRVYYRHRWIQTVSETVLKYCIQEQSGPQAGTFRAPQVEDVERHRVIITTLSTARLLSDLDLPEGFFTHIFLDEAAQALECDMLIPLSLAGPLTRVVLAGDHMQMSPEAFSDFARQQQFHKSLLERLYDMYPDDGPNKVMLCENYRANRAIIEFTSELFYDNKLKASKDPIAHSVYYPLTFFTARGEEVQHENSSGYYNTAEIYEIIEQVEHLQRHWPPEWGDFDDNSICVVAPYSDQVMHIRSELRKRKMFKVSVERVVNVQGKQFRVIVMSTVRTRHTIPTDAAAADKLDLGFLSNIKLLNTAITRAQSLVIAVGDPVSLCLAGRCSKVWEYYIEVCSDNNSFFGMTEPHLRSLLNNAEMTKTYILNPLAPEFIPKAVFPGQQGQPVFMAHPGPMSQVLGWPPNPSAAYRGPHPQMYPYGSPYVPVMYPAPYQPYPYMGPLVYRPHPGMYPTVGGKGQVRGAVPKQSAAKQARVPAQPVIPLQRDDEDHSESPRATPPKSSTSKQSGTAGSQQPKKSGQKRMVAVNMMPRMPMYQPYFAYPQYMLPPDDPRYLHMPQPPLYYTYPNMPRHPYAHPYMMPQPVHVQMQTRPGSGSVSPASSSDGATKGNRSQSPTGSNQSDVQSVSPGSNTGQHFQLLPNVKHVPTHLLYSTPGSGSNSRSSTPVLSNSPAPQQQAAMASDSPRASQGDMEFPSFRRRHHSGPRPVSQSPSYSSQGSHESSTSPVLNGDQTSTYRTETQTVVVKSESAVNSMSQSSSKVEKQSVAAKAPRALKLNTNTTGFSRQFSDELGTPTEITNIVRMIEENIEEVDEDQETGRTADMLFRGDTHQRSKPSPPAGRLFLNLPVHPLNDHQQSSSSSSQEDDFRPSYARVIRQQLPSYRETDFDPAMLEPQTPMTPAGFHTPGTDINTDPLELLRNLNINNDNLNRSAHGHF